jgi:hypothetical protein
MGSGNPGDKPGYQVVTLPTNDEAAAGILNALADSGYEVVAFDNGRVILGNYKKD